jgi:hypothetical protein
MSCDGRDEKRKERAREKNRKFFDWFHQVSSATRLQRMICSATALLRSDDLRGNYLVSNWIGRDPELVADYNGTKQDHSVRQMTRCDRRF